MSSFSVEALKQLTLIQPMKIIFPKYGCANIQPFFSYCLLCIVGTDLEEKPFFTNVE